MKQPVSFSTASTLTKFCAAAVAVFIITGCQTRPVKMRSLGNHSKIPEGEPLPGSPLRLTDDMNSRSAASQPEKTHNAIASYEHKHRFQSPDDNSTSNPRRGVEGEETGGVARVPNRFGGTDRAMPAVFPAAPADFGPGYPPAPGYYDPAVKAVSFSQAEPRLTVSEDGRPVNDPQASWMTGSDPQRYPDEYLLAGADRDHPVHYGPFERKGLNTEDVVGEFVDHNGKSHTRASNSIAIYAPRFGAVRTVTYPTGDSNVARLAGMEELRHNSGVRNRIGPLPYATTQQLGGVRVRSRASGVENKEWQSGVFNLARLGSHKFLTGLGEDFSYWLRGEMDQTNEARLAGGLEAASHWTRNENPVLIGQLDSLHEVTVKFRAAEMIGLEDEKRKPGELRILKLTDRSAAKPGEVITFVIRYDNLGQRAINHVRIVDNLTPRLEYIEDSATSDRPGDIVTQDNQEGSLVLTFKLDDPLPAETGGVITFQCRIR